MPPVVIDVDALAPGHGGASNRRPRSPVPTAVVLTLAVLAVLTGPALLRPTTLSLGWRLDTSSRFFWLTAQAAYTLDVVDPGTVALAARDLRNRSVLWTLPLHGPLAQVYAAADPLFASDFPPSGPDGTRTTAVGDVGTRVFPAAAVPLVYLAGDLAVTIDRDPTVAPLAPTGENGLEFSHLVTAYDLRTRDVAWRRPLPAGVRWSLPGVRRGADGIVGLPAGADWMVTDSPAGLIDVWDLRTGATVARRTVGPLAPTDYVTALADTVVLATAADTTLHGYEPRTLAPRWRLPTPLPAAEPVGCDPEVCLVTNRTVWIVDPRTGLVTARVNATDVRPGPPGRALVEPFGEVAAVVVTDDGMTTPLDQAWRDVDATAYRPTAVVALQHDLGRADVGLLDVGTGRIATLGQATRWSSFSRCLAVATTLACHDGETLSVWHHGP